MPHCTKCGTELKKGANFCHKCGQRVSGRLFERPDVKGLKKKEDGKTALWRALNFLIIGCLLFLFVFLCISSSNPELLVLYCGPGIIAWMIWHFLAPKIAYKMASHGFKKSADRCMFLADDPPPFEFKAKKVIAMSLYPMLFLFAAGTFFMDWVGPVAPEYDPAVNIGLLSIFLLPLASVIVIPTTWILDLSGIRCYLKRELEIRSLKEASIARFFIGLIGFGAFLAFLSVTIRTVLELLSEYSLGFGIVYVIGVLSVLFPMSLLPTSLYLSVSINKNMKKFIGNLEQKGILLRTKAEVKLWDQRRIPHCIECGRELPPRDKFCPYCGASVAH